jgi:hypothetical protein
MPAIANRDEHEEAIVVALLAAWEPFGAMPPEQIDYANLAIASREALRVPLYDAFLAAGLGLAIGGGWQGEIPLSAYADAWATGLAARLGADTAATTARKLSLGTGLDVALSSARAEVIAATEITRAVSAGESAARAGAAAVGLMLRSIWRTAEDEMVCDVCGPLDGTGVEVYGSVSFSGPPSHPNCRCWLDYE